MDRTHLQSSISVDIANKVAIACVSIPISIARGGGIESDRRRRGRDGQWQDDTDTAIPRGGETTITTREMRSPLPIIYPLLIDAPYHRRGKGGS